jgi:hypothetical protein
MVNAQTYARSRRRKRAFYVGRVLVLNTPPARRGRRQEEHAKDAER